MSDSFEDAVDSVQSNNRGGGNDGPASVVYEKREYPLIPEGTYKVICTKPKLRESRSEMDPPGTMKIALAWQTREAQYQGDDEKDHYYLVFNRPLGIAFGERANLPKLFKKLTGLDINAYVAKKQIKIPMANGKYREATELTFDHTMFENMEAEIVVTHSDYNGKTYPQIETVMCSKEVRESNARLLPPAFNEVRAATATGGQEYQQEAPKPKEDKVPEVAAPMRDEAAEEKLKQEAREKGFPID